MMEELARIRGLLQNRPAGRKPDDSGGAIERVAAITLEELRNRFPGAETINLCEAEIARNEACGFPGCGKIRCFRARRVPLGAVPWRD